MWDADMTIYNNYKISCLLLDAFNYALSAAQVTQAWNKKMDANDELEKMLKEAVVASFKIQSRYFLKKLRKLTINFSQDRSFGWGVRSNAVTSREPSPSVNHANVLLPIVTPLVKPCLRWPALSAFIFPTLYCLLQGSEWKFLNMIKRLKGVWGSGDVS
jgi:hypothetical protein